jgi:DNA-binding CsgD family transcriptional regulator
MRAVRQAGARLAVARVLWVGLAVLGLGIFATTYPLTTPGGIISPAASRDLAALGLAHIVTEQSLAGTANVLDGLLMLGFLAAAVFIFWRRSDDWGAIVFSGMLLTLGVTNAAITNHPDPSPLLTAFETVMDVLSLLALGIFPDGRLVPRWTAALLVAWLAYLIVERVGLLPGAATEDIIDLVFLGTAIAVQVYRYRRIATPTQQQQIKWVVLGAAVIILVVYPLELSRLAVLAFYGQSGLAMLAYEVVRAFARTIVQLSLPLVIAISVMRYRLWDIDFYINRGLVVAGLTLVLGLIFFGSALLLQEVLRLAIGGTRSTIALTASAVFVAILFQPTRQRIQSFIDHRFYGIRPYPIEASSAEAPTQPLVEPLSAREMDVLGLIDAGLSNRDIADELFLTVGTVKWHTNNIYTKLGVNSRTQALAKARDLNLLP